MEDPIAKLQEMEVQAERLLKEFGATLLKDKDRLDFRTFRAGLMYSHRDFDKFMKALKAGKKCAIVSGLNPSSPLHLGHKVVFDTNLFLQKKYGVDVFIPLSDDESYVARKAESQKQAFENAKILAKQLLALGFNPKKTYFIIDQVYTNIYNFAVKLSRPVTVSMAKATYGYSDESNVGLFFYPAVQSAHVLLPQLFGYEQVLVPIGIDEDTHLRISRDVAPKFGLNKVAVLHSKYMPGLDGGKMSGSKPHTCIFLSDGLKEIKRKINKAFSGGQDTIEEHRKLGGVPERDVAYRYLESYFLNEKESKKIYKDYKSGKMLSSEMKKLLYQEVEKYFNEFNKRLGKLKDKDVEKCFMTNDKFPLVP
jgi:tryptophanyl-tRNA synthetase